MSGVANQSMEPMESSDIDEARRVSERERANGASGTRCDIDAAKRRSQTENWEVRVNQSKPKLKHVPECQRLTRLQQSFPAGIEPTSKV
jgi:5-methylcytosine-specific restriction endonuclease McrA